MQIIEASHLYNFDVFIPEYIHLKSFSRRKVNNSSFDDFEINWNKINA